MRSQEQEQSLAILAKHVVTHHPESNEYHPLRKQADSMGSTHCLQSYA